jgi:hypothetical protein
MVSRDLPLLLASGADRRLDNPSITHSVVERDVSFAFLRIASDPFLLALAIRVPMSTGFDQCLASWVLPALSITLLDPLCLAGWAEPWSRSLVFERLLTA